MIIKNKIALIAVASVFAVSLNVNNAKAGLLGNLYVGGSVNKTASANLDGDSSSGLGEDGYSIAVGWELPVPVLDIRAELEYNDMGNSDVAGDLEYQTVMANAYFDIPFPLPLISPYIGAGFGQAVGGTGGSGESLDGDGMSQQFMLGLDLTIPATPFYASLEYKRSDTKLKDNSTSGTVEQDIVSVKVRYMF